MAMIESPAGFRFAALASGIKKSGKSDLALVFSERPAAYAGVFTQNKVCAAPVRITQKNIVSGQCQAILVNSGNANACTGAEGVRVAGETLRLAADQCRIDVDRVWALFQNVYKRLRIFFQLERCR